MEHMIDKAVVKKLRNEHSWSQDQLASVSGLSLRTVQRIESEGSCSLESKKALAAAFGINTGNLDVNTAATNALAFNRLGRRLGVAGAAVGLTCAYIGITLSFNSGVISPGEAGIYYGSISAFFGVCGALIGVISNQYKNREA